MNNAKALVDLDVLSEDGNGMLLVNFASPILREDALNYASKLLGTGLPDSIGGVCKMFSEFENKIKLEFDIASYSSVYSELKTNVQAQALKKIDENLSVYYFFINLMGSESKRASYLKDFEEVYFVFLLVSDYPIEVIFNSCVEAVNKINNKAGHVYSFLREYSKNEALGMELYNYGLSKGMIANPHFAAQILGSLYNAGNASAYSMAEELLSLDASEGLKAIYHFALESAEDIERALKTVKPVPVSTVEEANRKSLILCKIFVSDVSTKAQKDDCLSQISEMLMSPNQEIAHTVFHNFRYQEEGYEAEKYAMLLIYIGNTKNAKILDEFFYQLKDPKYLFEFMAGYNGAKGFRANPKFHNAVIHLWNTSPKETEAHILDFFRYAETGLLAVNTLLCSYDTVLPVNLLSLEKPDYQMNAIDSICRFPHSIDKLLSLLLTLRKSPFGAVKNRLAEQLQFLIFTTYHHSLFFIAEKHLDKKKDRKLIDGLKQALSEYEKMREYKSVKELDPNENERNNMDLYYNLERESNAKMMEESKDQRGFASMFKHVTIARGRAWKIDGQDDVVPMAKIETSMLININAYKNPITFERNLNK